jgi:IclR family transcriptional regulator, acetate operon repressor
MGIADTIEASEALPASAGKSDPGTDGSRSIQSVSRALHLLELISELGGRATLSELAGHAGLNVSTSHHLLATLVARGYVARSGTRGGYHLGSKILQLSTARVRQAGLIDLAAPYLRKLNEETGETVHLATLQGEDLVTLAKLEAHHAVRIDAGTVGKSDAAHATATGKAILAWVPERQMLRVLAGKGMSRFTDNTITDITGLIEELRHVRRNGFAMDREEFQAGVICVGAAVRDHSGGVIGSISVSTPASRADEAHLARITELLKQATRALSEEFGSPATGAIEDNPKGRQST